MVKKTVSFDIYIKTSEQTPTYSYTAKQKVMSNDKDSTQITFNLLDVAPEELSGSSASILLYMEDGSFFQKSDVTINRNSVIYTMKPEETRHSGNTKVQIVLNKGTVQTASLIYNFEIERGLEKFPIVEKEIQDWTSLTAEAKAFVEQIKDFTLEGFVENKMGEELANLETNYATRLTGLEQKDNQLTAQLAQTDDKINLTQSALDTKANLEIVRKKEEKIEPEDWSERSIALATGQGTINLETIPQNESVNRPKMTADMKSELNDYTEELISKVFKLHNRNFFNGQNTIEDYRKRFGSIKEIILIGFDHTKEHRLRLFARNNVSFKYRFIIAMRESPGLPWKDVFDAGADFVVNENIGGYTNLAINKGEKTVKMTVDYNTFPSGLSANDGLLGESDGRYLINENCFYQNRPEGIRNEVESVRSMVTQLNGGDSGVFAKKDSGLFKVKYKYGPNTNMVIEFDKLGPNEIVQPRRFYKETSNELNNDFDTPYLWYTLGTDWVSPYGGVVALTGTTTSFSGTVGGNHGTPNGQPTGEPISSEMYADGVLINDSEALYCERVQIIVKNYVSASNKINLDTGTKAQSFIETITYTITSGNMEVLVYLEALEDIRFDGYVGFQLTTNMYAGNVYFNDNNNKYTPDGTRKDSLPLPWRGDRMVYSGTNDVFVGYTNRDVGLGDLSYKLSQPVMYLATNRKVYAHLLGTSVTVNQGDSVYYSGGYSIMEPLECEGAESAYFIKLNDEKFYCVDFLAAKDRTFLKLPTSTIGKQIDIVDKSESIEADGVVSSSGLKLSANEHGTIRFKILGQ